MVDVMKNKGDNEELKRQESLRKIEIIKEKLKT